MSMTIETAKAVNLFENDESNNQVTKKNSVVVSVKNLVEISEMDELTKLFRKLIGIDLSNDSSEIVRQFSCSRCNRYWWRRVRLCKQVSSCNKCHLKYNPIPFDKEFGVGEFQCICSNKFRQWCSKDEYSQCKKCNNYCHPKIITVKPNTNRPKQNGYAKRKITSFFGKYSCNKCYDIYVDMGSGLVFRPNTFRYNYTKNDEKKSYDSGVGFCKFCRIIPTFSAIHVSTGSTQDSLSNQDALDLRFVNEEIDIR